MIENENEVIKELIGKFKSISSMGWVESKRSHNTGIGKTFEDLLDKEEDNLADPDYKGIEIKTHRSSSESYTTLFTSSPTGPQAKENGRLLETYGVTDEKSGLKKLHSSIFANRKTNFFNTYKFKIDVDRNNKKIYLVIYDMEDNILERRVYWTFEALNKCLERKLKTLAFVEGKSRIKDNGKEEFKYEKMSIHKFKNFDKFITAMEDGKIMVDIRIGVYGSGKNKGKLHDHGTGFRIKEVDTELLFDIIVEVE